MLFTFCPFIIVVKLVLISLFSYFNYFFICWRGIINNNNNNNNNTNVLGITRLFKLYALLIENCRVCRNILLGLCLAILKGYFKCRKGLRLSGIMRGKKERFRSLHEKDKKDLGGKKKKKKQNKTKNNKDLTKR